MCVFDYVICQLTIYFSVFQRDDYNPHPVIEANASTMLLAFSSAGEPLDALVTTNTAMLFTDSSGNFKIKRNIADTITVHTITISAAE